MKQVRYTFTVELHKLVTVPDSFDCSGDIPEELYPQLYDQIAIKDPSYTISEVIGETWEELK